MEGNHDGHLPQEEPAEKPAVESTFEVKQTEVVQLNEDDDGQGSVGRQNATLGHEETEQLEKVKEAKEECKSDVELDDGKEVAVEEPGKPKAQTQAQLQLQHDAPHSSQLRAPDSLPKEAEALPGEAIQIKITDTQDIEMEDNPQGGTMNSSGRLLNVTDALSYLDAVKVQFVDQPAVYNSFLDIMKDFKSQRIDTPGVIERVSELFKGHPMLIQGFNTFLPAGYRIECNVDQHDTNFITVTTPSGTTVQSQPHFPPMPPPPPELQPAGVAHPLPPPPPQHIGDRVTPAMQPAMEYVTRIKQRFVGHDDLYQEFLDILNQYKGPAVDETQLATRIAKLFQHAPDLLGDFKLFLPHGVIPSAEVLGALDGSFHIDDKDKVKHVKKKSGDAVASASIPINSGPKKRKKASDREKDKERERLERERELDREREQREKLVQSKKRVKHNHPTSSSHEIQYQQYAPPSPFPRHIVPQAHTFISQYDPPPPLVQAAPISVPQDERRFFDRVRRAIPNREVYNEFLKLVNLFTQDIIDLRRLVHQAGSFLTDELLMQFKEIVGYDGTHENGARYEPYGNAERTAREDLSIRYGPSYRRLPTSEVNVTCSGRDEMCKSVLNDEWVSHPTWASEDSGFVAHRKNAYEEALHRSEEERHEYDFHIEAISRAIAVLEPYNTKIHAMAAEEQPTAKIKVPLAGVNKAIFQRIIKKVYGRDAGLEVIEALHESPGIAIPIVFTRLRQKEAEWKTAQGEWNKVWREVDARNYQKSLDHQGITFKLNDKKVTTTKTFVNQIESAREEQLSKRASLIDPLFARTRPRYHMSFVIDDMAVLQDLLKLIFSFLDRMQHQIGFTERRRIEGLLRYFVPMFFMQESSAFNAAFVARKETRDSEYFLGVEFAGAVDDEEIVIAAGNSRSARNGRRGGNDLRKKVLKGAAQDKGVRKGKATTSAVNGSSRHASPLSMDGMTVDEPSSSGTSLENGHVNAHATDIPTPTNKRINRRGSFFSNTQIYSLLRLIELLYSRLLSCKTIASRLASDPSSPYLSNPVAGELSLVDMKAPEPRLAEIRDGTNPAAQFYEYLLVSCERLFDNEIDQQMFEDIVRYMFGTKAYVTFTIDKVLYSIIRQVQGILADTKSLHLLEGLKKERDIPEPSVQDQDDLRTAAEKVIGPEENLFRIDWIPTSNTITFQLLGKDDASYDDYDVYTGRWRDYIDSFVSDEMTKGLADVRPPFLTRNLRKVKATPLVNSQSSYSGLEIKVCVRTYKMFYVSHSEDFFWREWSCKELEELPRRMERRATISKEWLEHLHKEGNLPR